MEGQMTLWEYLTPTQPDADFHNMTEAEMVDYVGKAIGLTFTYNDFFERYEVKVKGIKKRFVLDIHYDHYSTSWKSDDANGGLFISVGYDYSHGGGGSPCDSLEEAIDYFKRTIERIKGGFYEGQISEVDDEQD